MPDVCLCVCDAAQPVLCKAAMPDVYVYVCVMQPSLCYTAPELVNSAAGNIFSAADVFSLGEPPLSNHLADSNIHAQALPGVGSCLHSQTQIMHDTAQHRHVVKAPATVERANRSI